jgi:branched-chain amino acid transport system substrate-binding protein
MRMKPLRLLATAALALVMGTAAQAQDKTVKIGVVLPYSGANADLGHQIDKAFDLYVKLHAKDIAPFQVQLIKRDEGPPTGAQAKTVATELITNDKVPVLAGFVFSPSAIALAPARRGSPIFRPTSCGSHSACGTRRIPWAPMPMTSSIAKT